MKTAMPDAAFPLHVATLGSALLWPLAAGVAVVIWSRARAAARARRMAAVDRQLQGMFRSVEAKPVPPKLAVVFDALAESDELTSAARRRTTPAGS